MALGKPQKASRKVQHQILAREHLWGDFRASSKPLDAPEAACQPGRAGCDFGMLMEPQSHPGTPLLPCPRANPFSTSQPTRVP